MPPTVEIATGKNVTRERHTPAVAPIAWEIQTTLIAIPALIAAGIVAVLFDASLTMVLVAAVAIALAVRLAVDGWRRLESADPARSRPPREDL